MMFPMLGFLTVFTSSQTASSTTPESARKCSSLVLYMHSPSRVQLSSGDSRVSSGSRHRHMPHDPPDRCSTQDIRRLLGDKSDVDLWRVLSRWRDSISVWPCGRRAACDPHQLVPVLHHEVRIAWSCRLRLISHVEHGSDTAWTVEDYNEPLVELAEEINPGQGNVCALGWWMHIL